MRARKTVITAATFALVLLPAASAMAGSGPAPAPAKQRAAAPSTAPSAEGNPLSARAQAIEVCADAYQIGTTAYIDRGGAHVASVKQFYSPACDMNYGYLWIWDGFRDKYSAYDTSIGIYRYDEDAVVGKVSATATHQQEFWSYPADTVNVCTAATGSLRLPGDPAPTYASTSKRC
ncbi:hypothetical protein GCM10018793_28900 [Streptomyces sulfonofaciens]|uniref:Secreted protein n=1 Tax=Streptomyces sulfonofaciens TaxID=68272 RepID=A0A919G6Z2_9ACTN|nr:hypothetical protein [Streptomyces sulfonofaciens]GHH78435.1 hypothetical protein GCM10018793_28900 [Streptomyces sulfonofaciens]